MELSFLVDGESYKASMAREKTWSDVERKELVTIRLFERDKSIILRSLTADNKETEVRSTFTAKTRIR